MAIPAGVETAGKFKAIGAETAHGGDHIRQGVTGRFGKLPSDRYALHDDREHTVDELLFWLPSALRRDATPFTRGFVVSILARSKRRGWKPSEKQLAIMRRIVAQMFEADHDDFDVIDRDG